MFLSREIDIELCQNYTKHIYIYLIVYKSCSSKQMTFSKYATNLKTTISLRNLRILDLVLLKIFNFYFAFFSIILIILLHLVRIVRITSPELQPMAVQHCIILDFRLYHVTTILHCHSLKFWWRNTDYTDYL